MLARPRRTPSEWVESAARVGVVAAILATAVHGIISARSLFADGTFYFWTELHDSGIFWYVSRISTQVVTQAPVALGINAGITDVGTLARLQSLGTIGIPLALWIVALVALRGDRLFWPMAATFAITYSTTGFMAVGEFNLSYAATAASAALLLKAGPISRAGQAGLLALAALLPFSYETVVFLAPLLATILVHRVRADDRNEHPFPRAFIVAMIALYSIGTAVSAWYILVPRDPENRSGAADILGALSANPQLQLTVSIGLLVVVGWSFGGRRVRWATSILAAGAGIVLVSVPNTWATAGLHYSARTVAGIALFLAIAVLAAARARGRAAGDATERGPLWIGPALLCVGSMVPLAILTAGFPGWLTHVDGIVSHPGGPVALEDSGVQPDLAERYGWAWTYTFLSRVLTSDGEVIILNVGQQPGGWLPDPIPLRYDTSVPILSVP